MLISLLFIVLVHGSVITFGFQAAEKMIAEGESWHHKYDEVVKQFEDFRILHDFEVCTVLNVFPMRTLLLMILADLSLRKFTSESILSIDHCCLSGGCCSYHNLPCFADKAFFVYRSVVSQYLFSE